MADDVTTSQQCDWCGKPADPESEDCTAVTCSLDRCHHPRESDTYHTKCLEKYLKTYTTFKPYSCTFTFGFKCPKGKGRGSSAKQPCPAKVAQCNRIIIKTVKAAAVPAAAAAAAHAPGVPAAQAGARKQAEKGAATTAAAGGGAPPKPNKPNKPKLPSLNAPRSNLKPYLPTEIVKLPPVPERPRADPLGRSRAALAAAAAANARAPKKNAKRALARQRKQEEGSDISQLQQADGSSAAAQAGAAGQQAGDDEAAAASEGEEEWEQWPSDTFDVGHGFMGDSSGYEQEAEAPGNTWPPTDGLGRSPVPTAAAAHAAAAEVMPTPAPPARQEHAAAAAEPPLAAPAEGTGATDLSSWFTGVTPSHMGPAELQLQCGSSDTAAAGRHAGAGGTFPAPGALLRATDAPFAGAAIMPAATYPSTLSTLSYVMQPWQAPTAPTTSAAAAAAAGTEFSIKAVQASEYAAMQQQQQQPPAAPAYVPMQQQQEQHQPPVSSAYVPPFRRNNTNTQVHGCPKPLASAQTSLPTPANPAQPLYDAPWMPQEQTQPQQVYRLPAAAPAAGCMPAPAASINVAPAASSSFSKPLQQQFKGSAPTGFDPLAAARHVPAAVPAGAGSLGPAASTAPGVLADGTWFGMQQPQQQFSAPVQGKPFGMTQYHTGFVSAAPVQAGAPATAVGYNTAPYAPAAAVGCSGATHAAATVGYNRATYAPATAATVKYNRAPYAPAAPAAAVGYNGAAYAPAPAAAVGCNGAAYAPPAAAAVGHSPASAAAAGWAAAYDAADEEDELEDMLRLLGVQP